MLIDNLATLKAKIKELLRDKNIKKIDLICADFYLLHTILMAKDEILEGFDKSIFKELLDEFFKLLDTNDRLEICIHTLGAISEEMNISDLQEDKTSYILSALRSKLIKEDEAKGIRGIRLINYKPNNIFVSFLSSLRLYFKEERNKDIESISELLEALGDEKLTSKYLDSTTKKSTKGKLISLMQEHKELIKAQIDLIQENQIFDELIKEELKEGFEQSFKALLEYINEFAKDNEGYKVLTSTLIISLMSIFMGGFVGFVGVSFATLDLVLTQMKNKQVFLNPLLEFLVSEFAIFAKHINTKLLSSALIVQKDKQRSLLDLSCLCMGENLSFYSSNLAYVAKLDESFDIENFFKQAKIKINSQITNKASREKQAFELNSNFKLSLQNSLKAYVKEQVNKFNHFAYIQAPHFNSSELALLFSDKNNKTASAMSKNYLLITNTPNKYNAKLTWLLTEQITNNKIIAKHRTKNKAFSFDVGKKSYDSARDYSNFRIDIEDKDDKPYVLQLCLFQRMSKQDYERQKEEFKEFKSECEKLSSLMNMANYLESSSDPDAAFGYDTAHKLIQDKKEALNKKFAKKEFSLPYISSHFKQNADKEDIIIREKEIIKEYLGLIERFLFENITLPKIKKSKAFIKPNYRLFECFIISYSMYHIACKFPSVNLKTKSCFVNILELINSFFLDGLDLASVKSYSMYECIEYDGSKFYMYLSNFTLANTDKKSTSFIQNTLNAFYQGLGFKNQSLYEELKKDLEEPLYSFEKDLIGLQIEPQTIQKFQEETKRLQNLEELLRLSFFKILASIFPFMNFFIDEELKNYEHCFKIFTLLLTEGLDRTFLNELGLFHLLKHKIHPDKSFIKISINDELLKAKGSKRLFLKLDLIHTQKQKALFEKKQALIIDKINDIATVNKISHQAAKTRLINELYTRGEIQVGKERLTKNDAKLLKNMSFYHSNKHQRAMIGHIQLKNILFEAKKFHKEKIHLQVKANFIETLVSLSLDLALELIFPSTYEAMQKEYEKIIHKFYTFKYDAPLAVEKEDYVYYPMRIDDKTMSFDFKDMIYGLELCTGVLSSHLSLVYNLYYEDSRENKEFALRRLLSYLIIDEKRGARSKDEIKEPKNFISDEEFFSQGYKNIDIEHCSIYQLETTSPLYKEFRTREKENGFRATITAPIRLYNEALSILEDYANNYFTNTLNSQNKYVFDKRKARRLIKALDLIGQNNLKALYIKESNLEHKYLKKLRQTKANEKMQTLNKYNTKQGSKKIIQKSKVIKKALDKTDLNLEEYSVKIPTKLIGRLATTIIIEDGLYLG